MEIQDETKTFKFRKGDNIISPQGFIYKILRVSGNCYYVELPITKQEVPIHIKSEFKYNKVVLNNPLNRKLYPDYVEYREDLLVSKTAGK